MRTLSAQDVVRVWELGQDKLPWYRAWLLLAPAFPLMPRSELISLSIGRRNAYLFRLREQLLGPLLESFVRCPRCQEAIEFRLNAREVCKLDPDVPNRIEHTAVLGQVEFQMRLLDSKDLAAVASETNLESARRQLAARAVLSARREGVEIPFEPLLTSAIDSLSEFLSDCDPQSDLRIALSCPACALSWSSPFDIASFLWDEVSTLATRLLNEVHSLATAYGWRESDILAMTSARRHHYLKMVAG